MSLSINDGYYKILCKNGEMAKQVSHSLDEDFHTRWNSECDVAGRYRNTPYPHKININKDNSVDVLAGTSCVMEDVLTRVAEGVARKGQVSDTFVSQAFDVEHHFDPKLYKIRRVTNALTPIFKESDDELRKGAEVYTYTPRIKYEMKPQVIDFTV